MLAQMMDRGDMGGTGWGWWIVGLVMMVALIALVVVLVMRTSTPQHAPETPRRTTAEELLAERLARGEIDADEYRQRLTALRGG